MGLALPFLVLFSMEVCCLNSGMGRYLTSFIQIRFLYLLPQNDHDWSPETVIWCHMFVLSEDSGRSSLRLKVWLDLSVDGCTPETLPLSVAYWLWWDLMVKLLKKFLLSFDLWPLTILRNVRWALMMLAENRASSWEIAEVQITIAFRKLLSVNRLSRSTQISRLHFTSWATLPGKTEKTDRKCLKRFRWMR